MPHYHISRSAPSVVPGREAVVMLRVLPRPAACRMALIRLLLPAFCMGSETVRQASNHVTPSLGWTTAMALEFEDQKSLLRLTVPARQALQQRQAIHLSAYKPHIAQRSGGALRLSGSAAMPVQTFWCTTVSAFHVGSPSQS